MSTPDRLTDEEQYVVVCEAYRDDAGVDPLPRLIGPFASRDQAADTLADRVQALADRLDAAPPSNFDFINRERHRLSADLRALLAGAAAPDHVQALANLQMQYDASQEALGEVMTENRENREAAERAQAKWDAIDPYADDAAGLIDVCARAAFMRDDLAGHVRGPWTYDTIPAEGRREFRATAVAVLAAARAEAERHVALLAGRSDASPEGGA